LICLPELGALPKVAKEEGMESEDHQKKEPVSETKKAANRANAQLAPGPTSPAGKERVSKNAIKHGLRGRAFKFQDEEERADFEKLIRDLEAEYAPVGILEREMVKEIAVCIWKIAIGDSWLMDDVSARREAGAAILDTFMNSSEAAGNPFARQNDEVRSAAQASWDCRELVVSVGGEDVPGIYADENDTSRMQFQAKLVGSADTILRYQNAWKRDLHRAIESLRKLQQARKA
jgi:hypothetical protein